MLSMQTTGSTRPTQPTLTSLNRKNKVFTMGLIPILKEAMVGLFNQIAYIKLIVVIIRLNE